MLAICIHNFQILKTKFLSKIRGTPLRNMLKAPFLCDELSWYLKGKSADFERGEENED